MPQTRSRGKGERPAVVSGAPAGGSSGDSLCVMDRFLQWKTEQGNETVLSMLRSHAGGAEPEKNSGPRMLPPYGRSLQPGKERARSAGRERQDAPVGRAAYGTACSGGAPAAWRKHPACSTGHMPGRWKRRGDFHHSHRGTVRDTGKTVLFSAGRDGAGSGKRLRSKQMGATHCHVEENGFLSEKKERGNVADGKKTSAEFYA